jgi:hypothetical protein
MAEAIVSVHVPYITITLEILELSFARELEALVNTGFTHGVAVPRAVLPPGVIALSTAVMRMADGERRYFPAYLGNARVGDRVIEFVSVFELGDVPIVGLDIITRFRVTIDHELTITFEELPDSRPAGATLRSGQ